MSVFSKLTTLRAFEAEHLPFLVTREDFDIVRVIGLYQELAKPLLLKQLFLEGIGSFSTITRRLTRLRAGGHVLAGDHGTDRRSITLSLNPNVLRTYLHYGTLLASLSD